MKIILIIGGIVCLAGIASFLFAENIPGLASVIASSKRTMYAECISSYSDKPLQSFLITEVELNGDHYNDAFVQSSSDDACGTAGCIYELCLSDANGFYTHTSFGYAAKNIEASETKTSGMSDIILNDDRSLKMTWSGSEYILAD
jgi:hypothetical protein